MYELPLTVHWPPLRQGLMEHGLTVGLMEVQKMYKMDDDKYNIT